MKTAIKCLLLALTLTTFYASQAEINKPIGQPKKAAAFQTGIYTTAEGRLQIALNKQPGGVVTVRLINVDGKEVFGQSIGQRQQAVRLRLDVSALPDGVYQVAIRNGVDTTTQELTLATKQPGVASRFVALNQQGCQIP